MNAVLQSCAVFIQQFESGYGYIVIMNYNATSIIILTKLNGRSVGQFVIV